MLHSAAALHLILKQLYKWGFNQMKNRPGYGHFPGRVSPAKHDYLFQEIILIYLFCCLALGTKSYDCNKTYLKFWANWVYKCSLHVLCWYSAWPKNIPIAHERKIKILRFEKMSKVNWIKNRVMGFIKFVPYYLAYS